MRIWNRREVLVTDSAERFGLGQNALRQAGISFTARTVHNGGSGRAGAYIPRFGERAELENDYYIYVDKADEERAVRLLRTVNHA